MALANTVSLNTNLNVDPYYDDFDEAKNFYRILFRPGQAVQARELTQMQTMLQNQVDRFAENIFKEGSIVHGIEMNYDQNYRFIKIQDADENNATVNVAAFVDTTITGANNAVTAIVINSADGSEVATPNTKTLFLKYTSAGSDGTTKEFNLGEKVSNGSISANVLTTNALSTGYGSAVSIGEGIIFAKDHFIYVPAQTLILDKYSPTPTYRVGFTITESIIDSDDDASLLDPAQGAYNYTAPGANRLKITATLAKKSISASSTDDFVDLIEVRGGVVQIKTTKPLYAQIKDYIAGRTYDESGNYVVYGLNLRLREHLNQSNNQGVYTSAYGGNTSYLSADVESGKAYVFGYDIENLLTRHVPIRKATDYESIEQLSISTNYSNYVTVNEVAGLWDINSHDQVSLRNTVANAVSNSDYSSTGAPGAEIGTARVRAIEYVSGTPGDADAVYNLYLYNINMTANTFSTVRSVYYNQATLADAKADIVLTSGAAAIQEIDFNQAVYTIPAKYIRTIRDTTGAIDTNFRFLKKFDVSITSGGTFTLNTGAADEQFPFSTGALNSTQKRSNFYLTLNGAAQTANLTGTASITSGGNTITGVGTNFDTDFNVGDNFRFTTYANNFTVSAVGSATSISVLQNAAGTVSGDNYYKYFYSGQVLDMGGVGSDSAARSITISSTTAAAFDIQETLTSTVSASVQTELSKIDGQEASKVYKAARYVIIDCSSNSANTVGPWNLGFSDVFSISSVRKKTGSTFAATTEGTDVTTNFNLDTGQKDNFYDHGKLKLKSTSALSIGATDFLLVKLNYFTHDTSQGVGYFSVDSYPIDDANTSNTTAITTQEIPIFSSPVTGESYSLRDCIDIRPRITDTATDATLIGSASTNPATSNTIVEPTGGIHFSPPNENFTVDLDYYLRRKDLIALDKNGIFRVIEGVPSLYPYTPGEPSDAMTLGRIDLSPYPSLPISEAKKTGRDDLACAITPVRNQRFTMKDISVLKDRIDNIQYYMSLSLLEKDAKDLLITDVSGNDRFKNGILVDNFTGHNIGNVFDDDYKIAIDDKKREARPAFNLNNVDVEYKSANSTGVVVASKDVRLTVTTTSTFANLETITSGATTGVLRYQVGSRLYLEEVSGSFSVSGSVTGGTSGGTGTVTAVQTQSAGDLATLDYTNDRAVSQNYATGVRNAVGIQWNWIGEITLTPDTDNWVDTTQKPDVLINFDQNYDNWTNLANAWGTQWNDWKTVATEEQNLYPMSNDGEPGFYIGNGVMLGGDGRLSENYRRETVILKKESQIREGLRASAVTPKTKTDSTGERITNVNIVPFIKTQVIQVSGTGFKPNSKLYTFFDGENVSAYITPTNSSFANTANEGTTLTTSSTGSVYATFRIPNSETLRFRTGRKVFRFTDSAINAPIGDVSTSGETQFNAFGLSTVKEETIISTRYPELKFEVASGSQTTESYDNKVLTSGTREVGRLTPTSVTSGVLDPGGGIQMNQVQQWAGLEAARNSGRSDANILSDQLSIINNANLSTLYYFLSTMNAQGPNQSNIQARIQALRSSLGL